MTRSLPVLVFAAVASTGCLPPPPVESPKTPVAAPAKPSDDVATQEPKKVAVPPADVPEVHLPLSPQALELRARGMALLDQGKYEQAEAVLGQLLALDPTNVTNAALHEAALISLRKSLQEAAIDLGAKPTIHLEAPPLDYALVSPAPVKGGSPVTLAKLSDKKNNITDVTVWLHRNGVELPRIDVTKPREGVPQTFGTNALLSGMDHEDHLVLVYGARLGNGPEFLAIAEKGKKVRSVFDLSSYLTTARDQPSEATYVRQNVGWARMKDGVLFVATSHRTYAASSGGKNAFLTALDATTGKMFWRSQPLVCNAEDFVLRGSSIICGYGFTAEPDFLYVLDQATGKVTSKIPVATGPDLIIDKDDKLYVRTYDTDYVFAIK